MPISQKVLHILLAQIERLQRENALLREKAGISAPTSQTPGKDSHISAEEKNALLRKTP